MLRRQAGAAAIRIRLTERLQDENRNFAEADLRLRALQADVLDRALPQGEFEGLRALVRNPPVFPVPGLIFPRNRPGPRF
jgi:hypothetical protein